MQLIWVACGAGTQPGSMQTLLLTRGRSEALWGAAGGAAECNAVGQCQKQRQPTSMWQKQGHSGAARLPCAVFEMQVASEMIRPPSVLRGRRNTGGR